MLLISRIVQILKLMNLWWYPIAFKQKFIIANQLAIIQISSPITKKQT